MKINAGKLLFTAAIGAGLGLSAASTLRAQKNPTPTPAPTAAAKADGTKADGTTRQTAKPWTGSPYGPGNAYEATNRARELKIEQVMDSLKMGPGTVVADIGAGGGWFSMLAARRVGPKGRVYAQDILPKYTRFIAQRARREGFKNVRTIVGTVSNPKLPNNALDAVLILNAYHEFEQPLAMLRQIRTAMRPGARLAFIERDDDDLRQQASEAIARTGQPKHRVDEQPDGKEWTDDHRLALPIVERETAQAGFQKVTSYDLGADHYLLVVQKPAP